MALIIDVETTGLPDCSGLGFGKYPPIENLDKYDSSRIVQISIMICNERFEELELKDFIIKADGFSIDNSGFHGITNEISEKEGKHFKEIAEILLECLSKGSYVIAHNAKFDVNVIKSELFRLGLNSIIEELDSKKILCTMEHTKSIVKATNKYGIKYPSLAELYKFACKKDIENAHNSKYDVINLHEICKNLYESSNLNLELDIDFSKLNLDESKK
jgi:hypothetical protein